MGDGPHRVRRPRRAARQARRVVLGVLLAAPRVSAQDSTFQMATNDPARSPSPFIGNGRMGVVIPVHGIAPARSFLAGVYAEGAGDVPRIAGLPAWNAIDVFDGARWLGAEPAPDTVLRAYTQTLDMRTGTARTSYEWTDGAKRTTVRVESFVSRADAHLAAIRLVLTPRFAGSMRVRFDLTAWPPPNRLALARLERIPRAWGPAELWYPGHMTVRGRGAAIESGGGRLWISATPDGRATAVAEAAVVTWSGDLAHARARTIASGDTAAIEVTFDATPGNTYTFEKLVSIVSAAETSEPLPSAQRRADAARVRGVETTPRFAGQNASSEIHVTGDVAIAQWQYYLATDDSAWLARDGSPVIRAAADFWTSRATYDSTRDQYHLRNVVSVDEGLVGVTDDAYTNAVARRTLEVASAASRRLHIAADPRWERVATRLHIPFDSTRNTYRTYAGAPDSTLGSVTAMLSYPLALPMSEDVKRTNLEHGVALMMKEGSGAMMGITLLSVVAAELGDRALLDTLLPRSFADYLKGPFLMLSETPTNNAVNFLTGAGGFLQQVIFGYTGLRLGEDGLVPAYPPLLPSRVTRLVLHNVHVHGRRYDVIVDQAGRRIVSQSETPRR